MNEYTLAECVDVKETAFAGEIILSNRPHGSFSLQLGHPDSAGKLFLKNGCLEFEGEATPAAHHFFAYIKTLWNQVDRDHGLYVDLPVRDKDTGRLKHAKSFRLTIWAPVYVATGEVDTSCNKPTNDPDKPSHGLMRGWEWRQFEMFPVVQPEVVPPAQEVVDSPKKKVMKFLRETIEMMTRQAELMSTRDEHEAAGEIQNDAAWYTSASSFLCPDNIDTIADMRSIILEKISYQERQVKICSESKRFVEAGYHARGVRKFKAVLTVINEEEK